MVLRKTQRSGEETGVIHADQNQDELAMLFENPEAQFNEDGFDDE